MMQHASKTASAEMADIMRAMPNGRRDQALRQIIDLFVARADAFSEADIATFDAIVAGLAAGADDETRRQLAQKLAPVVNAPTNLVGMLAADDVIDVARPILTLSPALSPERLVEIIESKGTHHQKAIAGRPNLCKSVVASLVAIGSLDVLNRLLNNKQSGMSGTAREDLRLRIKEARQEKRSSRRIPVVYEVWLDLPARPDLLACTMLDISHGGARLSLPASTPLPDRVTVYLAPERRKGRPCRVAWRNGDSVGLQFVPEKAAQRA